MRDGSRKLKVRDNSAAEKVGAGKKEKIPVTIVLYHLMAYILYIYIPGIYIILY
jgi:hypothetical protein